MQISILQNKISVTEVLIFSASRKELQASSKSIETDIKVKLRNNTEVQVQKVRVSKVASSVFVKCDKKFWGKSKVYMKGKDSKGNPVIFFL